MPLGCSGATVSLAFAAPLSTTTCGGTNVALKALEVYNPYTSSGCLNLPKGSTHSFALSNPNGQSVSVILTDGSGAKNCGYRWDGGGYNYYKEVLASTATSISLPDVPCESSPCCALIYCDSGRPCIGLSITQSFTPAGVSKLAAGAIAGIVVAVLAAGAGAALMRWRKVRRDQQMAMAAPAVVQIQVNPVQPYGGAPPAAPYGGAPPTGPAMMPPGPPPPPLQPSYVWH